MRIGSVWAKQETQQTRTPYFVPAVTGAVDPYETVLLIPTKGLRMFVEHNTAYRRYEVSEKLRKEPSRQHHV
jgi:hypothetical protein